MPLRIIPDRSEAPEDFPQSSTAKGCNVFCDDKPRARFRNDAEHFEPEAGPRAVEAGTVSGKADILAGEPAANDVDCRYSSIPESIRTDSTHVAENRNPGPVTIKDGGCVCVLLTKSDGAEPAGAFESKRKTPYAAEKVENGEPCI